MIPVGYLSLQLTTRAGQLLPVTARQKDKTHVFTSKGREDGDLVVRLGAREEVAQQLETLALVCLSIDGFHLSARLGLFVLDVGIAPVVASAVKRPPCGGSAGGGGKAVCRRDSINSGCSRKPDLV